MFNSALGTTGFVVEVVKYLRDTDVIELSSEGIQNLGSGFSWEVYILSFGSSLLQKILAIHFCQKLVFKSLLAMKNYDILVHNCLKIDNNYCIQLVEREMRPGDTHLRAENNSKPKLIPFTSTEVLSLSVFIPISIFMISLLSACLLDYCH